MRVSLIGYNRSQVNNNFNKLDLENKNQIADLIIKIEDQKKYKDSISENLKSLLDEYKNLDSERDFLNFAKRREVKIGKFINKITEDEIKEIILTEKTQLERYEKEIEGKKIQIQNDKEIIDGLTEKMLEFFDEIEEYEGAQEVEKIEEYLISEASCKVIQYVNKNTMVEKKDNENIYNEKNNKFESGKSKNDNNQEKNLMSKLTSIEKEESSWEINENKITSDGSKASQLDNMSFNRLSVKENIKNSEENIPDKQLNNLMSLRLVTETETENEFSSGFWSDNNDLSGEGEKKSQQKNTDSINNKNEIFNIAENEVASTKENNEVASTKENNEVASTKENNEVASTKENNEVASTKENNEVLKQEIKSDKETENIEVESEKTADSSNTNQPDGIKNEVGSSKTVSNEINNIRYKYICGKIAGEDIFDLGGKIIIKRGSTITTEVIVKAEQEGKLSDLIVNMILPGMD